MLIREKKVPNHRNQLTRDIVHTVARYAKSQMMIALLITVVSWIILLLFNIRYAALLAIGTGFLSIVPVIGMTFASIIVALVAIFDGVRFTTHVHVIVEGLVIFIIYGCMNFVIDYVLSPYLAGSITTIHPIIFIIGILVGTVLFGIPGAILVTPTFLIAKTIMDHYRKS